ncbi:helix-turn-helix domain-containing protein [Pollutibacter soli]|uniref:helix-turn-helix domain-containing protein n=1 Tax=Pollutibacter soli TaxID=3034157 RepID=UPI00301370A4
MEEMQENRLFELAVSFVQQSDRHIFLTGKAGTGKTTFLRHISQTTAKKIAIVAPTGVAAINAGGVTIHSFFQLPPGIFISGILAGADFSGIKILTPETIVGNHRFSLKKKELIRELDTLIIDEVSMVKADLLDAMDFVLRWIRQDMKTPFGGVQVIYIGDLFQLPPVVNDEEWSILKKYYRSSFFFDANVIQEQTPLYLELKTIYRQNNPAFIQLLNAIRNNRAGEEEFSLLHSRYHPGFIPDVSDPYITLTTHNARVDIINRSAINAIDSPEVYFKAKIKGDFPEKSYPVDPDMLLKESAQIMFIKNDKGETRKYYNGKIGRISRIEDGKVFVRFPDTGVEIEVEKEVWRNIRYQLNKEKNILEEEELGSFEQFPIRLAWAITIHKSQGLTFEKAIVDAGHSFSAGQVYVALSRMTGLEGLILKTKIPASAIQTDERVIEFSSGNSNEIALKEILLEDQKLFIRRTMIKVFEVEKLHALASGIVDELKELLIPESEELTDIEVIEKKFAEQKNTGNAFQRQLARIFQKPASEGHEELHRRVVAGAGWFNNFYSEIDTELSGQIHLSNSKKRLGLASRALKNLQLSVRLKIHQLTQVQKLAEGFLKGISHDELLAIVQQCSIPEKPIVAESVSANESFVKSKTSTAGKVSSPAISLALFREGKSIDEIALERSFTIETIYKHLLEYLPTGETQITDFVSEEKHKLIREVFENTTEPGLKVIKEKLGDEFSYHEIRAVSILLKLENQSSGA